MKKPLISIGSTLAVACLSTAVSSATIRPPGDIHTPGFHVGVVGEIQPTVEVHAGYSAKAHRLILSFVVGNGGEATNAVAEFAMGNIPEPYGVRAPAQWMGLYGVLGSDSLLMWTCADSLTPPPTRWTADTWRSPYMIDPGDTIHRFQVVTEAVPLILHCYAWGYDSTGVGGMANTTLATAWTCDIAIGEVTMNNIASVRLQGRPQLVELREAGPNPSARNTSVEYALPRAANVQLVVFDVGGARVRVLVDGRREAGVQAVAWDGYSDTRRPCIPGQYFARLVVDGRPVGTRKLTILR
jgi:hypothetical protein